MALAGAAGCGGGGGDGNAQFGGIRSPGGSVNVDDPGLNWVPGVFLPSSDFAGRCAVPRPGDLPGSRLHENHWLRSWSDELYLWYDEIVDRDPAPFGTHEYFDLLKTDALTPSGRAKDDFHFHMPTDEWESLSQSGVSAGYGAGWVVMQDLPPQVLVGYTEPGSPADMGGLQRGDRVVAVDGVALDNATGSQLASIADALFGPALNATHEFTIEDSSHVPFDVSLTAVAVTSTPVLQVSVVETAAGRVGYLLFNAHIDTAEQQLVDAVNELRDADIDDLVLDLRYNGGGRLAIASQLAYMIAGADATSGLPFEVIRFNDKHPEIDPFTGQPIRPFPFIPVGLDFSAEPNSELPTLDLPRVFILAGSNTCSASESIINGLRGIDVDVILVGETTCGKPYGFIPADNCGTTYFTIQLTGVNAMGFGDYADGFSPMGEPFGVQVPGCAAPDDMSHALGDADEARFAAALAYRASGECPDSLSQQGAGGGIQRMAPSHRSDGVIQKPAPLRGKIVDG